MWEVGLLGVSSMVARMALLGESWVEEGRKEKKMMYGKRLHGWEGPGW